MKHGKFSFKHDGDYNGEQLTIVYTGTLAATKQMKGTVDVQPFNAAGTFTAVPAAATPVTKDAPAKP